VRAFVTIALSAVIARTARAEVRASGDAQTADAAPCFEDREPPRYAPFARGAVRFSLSLALKSAVVDDYAIVGIGAGYYALDGLELGIDYQAWTVGDPVLNEIAPEFRYVLHFVHTLKPYVGAYYGHAFVSGHPDLDRLGVRVGLYYAPETARAYFGGGVVYEHLLDCAHDDIVQCDGSYPEASFAVSF